MKSKFIIPSVLVILGKKYKIKFDKETNACGYIDYGNDTEEDIGEIAISTNIKSVKLLKETLLHEIIHAITEQVGLTQGLPHSVIEIISDVNSKAINKVIDWKFKIDKKR